MKKFNFFWTLLLLLGVVSVASSCSDDDDVPTPNVSVTVDLDEMDDFDADVVAGVYNGKTNWTIEGTTDSNLSTVAEVIELINGDITVTITELTTLDDTFAGSENLVSITLDAAATIEASALADCTALKTLVATKVTSLGNSALEECPALTTVVFDEQMTTVGTTVFGTSDDQGTNTNTEQIALTVYVEDASEAANKVSQDAKTDFEGGKVYFGATEYTFSSVICTDSSYDPS